MIQGLLRYNTATTVTVGPLIDYTDARSPIIDNDVFDPTDLVCRLYKGATGSTLTLSKTSGNNDMVLDGYGMASLELTAGNVDTCGLLRVLIINSITDGVSSKYTLPVTADFMVVPAAVYDSLVAGTDELPVDAVSLLANASIMPGGTMTLATMLKIMTAWAAGSWRAKTGETGVYEVLDPDNGSSVVMTVTPRQTSPYKGVTVP
jgi:hypothetical protein